MKRTTKVWSKMLMLGVSAMVLAFGLAAVGCKDNSSPNAEAKSITITGLSAQNGKEAIVMVTSGSGYDAFVVAGEDVVANGVLTVALKNENETNWTGSGSYYVDVSFYVDGVNIGTYVYTNGKTLSALGITDLWNQIVRLPKVAINSRSTTLAFGLFEEAPGDD
ncbi:MAG: hypothetical protein Ta2A_00990 [Treponemataceae bacterium]|nr:MAG: hypothetical protein Ta2A_00990 [Treponemataceae bacterium]